MISSHIVWIIAGGKGLYEGEGISFIYNQRQFKLLVFCMQQTFLFFYMESN